jgi:hypothetical protein
VRAAAALVVSFAVTCFLACSPSAVEAPSLDTSADSGADGTADAAGADATVEASVGCLVCSDATEDLPAVVRVTGIIGQICSKADNCHGSGAGEMGTSPGHEFGSLVGVVSYENPPMLRVAPGDPANSYVFLKLACDGGIVGACMPFGAYDPVMAQAFHEWIEAGAPMQ